MPPLMFGIRGGGLEVGWGGVEWLEKGRLTPEMHLLETSSLIFF